MKNYLVIGGSSGIGKAIVTQLANENHQVFATYNNNVVSGQSGVEYRAFDVMTQDFDVSDLPETLDGLVYCPGNINLKPFHRFKEKDFMDDYRLQVVGAVKVIQSVLSRLKKTGNASIVLFSTVAVQQGFNFHSQVAASKGAIEGLTRALSAEFAPTIRVNAIAPSLTDTPLAAKLLNSEQKRTANAERNPLKKIGTAENVADAALFLLSEKSTWVTGQIFHIDGGMSKIKM